MSDTSARVHKSSGLTPRVKLCRMLESTLRKWPKAKLLHGRAGFGASLDATTSIWIRSAGPLSAEDTRDLLALFATWLVVDPERLLQPEDEVTLGVSRMEAERQFLSNGRLA